MATYAIHSTVRGVQTRTQRATQAKHHGLKQFVGDKQQRLIRGRPIRLTEEDFLRNLADIKAKAEQGILEVRTESGQLVDLATLQPVAAAPPPPLPNPPLDSIANDKPWGQEVPPFAGDTPSGTEPALLTSLEQPEDDAGGTEGQPSFVTSATDPAPQGEEEAFDEPHDPAPETVSNRPGKGSKKGKR